MAGTPAAKSRLASPGATPASPFGPVPRYRPLSSEPLDQGPAPGEHLGRTFEPETQRVAIAKRLYLTPGQSAPRPPARPKGEPANRRPGATLPPVVKPTRDSSLKSTPTGRPQQAIKLSDGLPGTTAPAAADAAAAATGAGPNGIFNLTELGLETAKKPNPWDAVDNWEEAEQPAPPPAAPAAASAVGGRFPPGNADADAAPGRPPSPPLEPYRREELDLWYPTHKRLVQPHIASAVAADIRALLLTAPEVVARLRPPPTISRAAIEFLSTRRAPGGDSEWHWATASPLEWARWKTGELAAARRSGATDAAAWAAEEETKRRDLESWRAARAEARAAVETELAARARLAASHGRKVAAYLRAGGDEKVAEFRVRTAARRATAAALRADRESHFGAFSVTATGALKVVRPTGQPPERNWAE